MRTENSWASEQLVLGEWEEAPVVRGKVGKGCRAEPRKQQLAGGWGRPGSRDRKLQLDDERWRELGDEAGKTSSWCIMGWAREQDRQVHTGGGR